MSHLTTTRCPRGGIAAAGMYAGMSCATMVALLALTGCGGGGSPPPPPPPVVVRPPVEKETLLGLESRDLYAEKKGTGYAHVCPGADDRQGRRSFLILVSGIDPDRVDAAPQAGELESTCAPHAQTANYHLVTSRWINGADYVQRNAGVIRDLIETMTDRYEIDAGDRVAIVGESMGGVVVRYALQQMQAEGVAHHVDLFVSVDSPQQGAYVPIGTQHVAALFKKQGGQDVLDYLDTPAARQMLLYHYTQGSKAQTWHDLHRALYYDELQGALGGFLRDPELRTVGVSSGRIGGGFEQPLPGAMYYDGTLTLSETIKHDFAFRFPLCNTDFDFSVKVELIVDVQAWSLDFTGAGAPGLSKVASRRIRAEIDDLPLSNVSDLSDHFTDLAIKQLPGVCRTIASAVSGVVTQVAKPMVELSIDQAERKLEEAGVDFYAAAVSVPTSARVTEGAAGGTSDAIAQMRDMLANGRFKPGKLDPEIAGKQTNMFIPFASALMLDGISPTDPMTEETVRAASAFDEVYFETQSDRPHLQSSSDWFQKEVLALFDAP